MRGLAIVLLFLTTLPAAAVQPDEVLSDPALEERAREISKELRCLVCRNESIDESNADLARDLRLLVRERLTAGDTNEEAVTYIVDRYGEYVLLRPTFSVENAILWLSGPIFLLLGALAAWVFIRRSRSAPVRVDAPLTPEEKAKRDAILGG